MGTDKAMLGWDGGTLLEHMVRTLETVAGTVRVLGPLDLADRNPDRGPVEGIATALGATTTSDNLIVAVDLPYIDTRFLEYFVGAMEESGTGFVTCEVNHQTPLCLGIHRSLLIGIDAYLESGGRSARGLFDTIGHNTITEDQLIGAGFSTDLFRNLNTPEDYSETQKPSS
jgi:molybdopterin-guanine dinucleotide biosynthesis protein A